MIDEIDWQAWQQAIAVNLMGVSIIRAAPHFSWLAPSRYQLAEPSGC
jgi:hypothetical protein